jgi:hypothetical protein
MPELQVTLPELTFILVFALRAMLHSLTQADEQGLLCSCR